MGQGNKTRKRYLNKSGKINSLVEDTDTKEYYINDITGESIGKVVGGNIEAVNSKYVKEIKENAGIIKSILQEEGIVESKNISQKPEETLVNAADAVSGIRPGNYPKDPEGFFIGRYPINQKDSNDFDHFKITCYEHQPGFLPSGRGGRGFIIDDIDDRKKVRKGVVSLPMQPSISESMNVNWGSSELNPLQIMGANVAMPLMGLDFDGAMNALTTAGNQAAGDLNADLIKSFFAGRAVGADLIGRGTGQAINNNVEVLFNGPELRSFNYRYRFTPREPKEAKEIKQIIRFFKKSMAPKRSASRIFLKSPNVFKLKYTFKDGGSHPFLNNIKMCALKSFTVDYTPDGSYSTYSDDGEGDGSMTSYQVSLGFAEMTPIYNDDYWNDPEGREGTGF
tara:strand:+ start:60 stop:1241 length:1182 start_codon:yes stop_codon:yes gene_type:complete